MKLKPILGIAGVFSVILTFYQNVEGQSELCPERYGVFLSKLEGSWKGNATITPVGPRPYDITFIQDDYRLLAGASRPSSVSTHYWNFYVEDNILKLRFLSTFAGNRQPIYLKATAEKDGTWIFNTDDVQFLEVRIQPQMRTMRIQIYLRGEHHVEIELSRPE